MIVDLRRGVVEAYRTLLGEGYRDTTKHQRSSEIALALAPKIVLKFNFMFEVL